MSMKQAEDLAEQFFEMSDRCSPQGLIRDDLVDLIAKWERLIELVHSRCGTFERGKVPPLRPRGRHLHKASYKILTGSGGLYAEFPDADWALSLTMAITGRQFWPHEVIPEQLALFDFAGQPR